MFFLFPQLVVCRHFSFDPHGKCHYCCLVVVVVVVVAVVVVVLVVVVVVAVVAVLLKSLVSYCSQHHESQYIRNEEF